MTLRLYGTTSGYVDIDAPSIASNNTIVMPNDSSALATLANVSSASANAISYASSASANANALALSYATSASANADTRSLSYASSASANANALALSYASSASANADTRSLSYANSASANANVYAQGYINAGRNLLYNGAMQVHQRGTTSASVSTSGYYTVDRWISVFGSLGTWTQSVENDAPTGSGFRKSLKMLCVVASASPSAGNIFSMAQRLEGFDVQSIAKGTSSAKPLTLSFWVKGNVLGTYVAELEDTDNNRHVNLSYTINAANTWERKVLNFPADTTGAFDNDNTQSLILTIWMSAGTDYTSGTLQSAWTTKVAANRASGQVNLASATNNYWQVTGIQLETGTVASPFEFKSYGQELAECQRYYYVVPYESYWFQASDSGYPAHALGSAPFPVTMRSAPTITLNYAGVGSVDGHGRGAESYVIAGRITTNGFGAFYKFTNSSLSTAANFNSGNFHYSAAATCVAEL